MNLFGIGLPEIVLVLVIAVIVVGPKRLPEVAVQLARAIRYLRGYATDATVQIRAEMDALTKEYEAVRQELREFRRSMGSEVATVTDDMGRILQESTPMIEPSAEPLPEQPQSRESTSS